MDLNSRDNGAEILEEQCFSTIPGMASGPHALFILISFNSWLTLSVLKSIYSSPSISKSIRISYEDGSEN